MLQNTTGIVLRTIKYGESSLICSIFTRISGVQSYIIQGVRSSKSKNNRSGLLQPGMMLDLVIYQKPQQNLHRIKEFQPAYIYMQLQEEIVKNSIALFSIELLLRLLPEHAPMPELFDFSTEYLKQLDQLPVKDVANFPVYFLVESGRLLGYEISGSYSSQTPYINIHDGSFSAHPPSSPPYLDDIETQALDAILQADELDEIKQTGMNAITRFHLLDWYIQFMHTHTQHMGNIRSLSVLQSVLHD